MCLIDFPRERGEVKLTSFLFSPAAARARVFVRVYYKKLVLLRLSVSLLSFRTMRRSIYLHVIRCGGLLSPRTKRGCGSFAFSARGAARDSRYAMVEAFH